MRKKEGKVLYPHCGMLVKYRLGLYFSERENCILTTGVSYALVGCFCFMRERRRTDFAISGRNNGFDERLERLWLE